MDVFLSSCSLFLHCRRLLDVNINVLEGFQDSFASLASSSLLVVGGDRDGLMCRSLRRGVTFSMS